MNDVIEYSAEFIEVMQDVKNRNYKNIEVGPF